MFKPELLSPAGTLKNMRYAFAYGADAIYAGQPRYSLRVRNNEFDHANLKVGIDEAHALGKQFYVVVNIAPHNAKLKTFIKDLEPVVAMGPEKHLGYAVQWFAMAAALCALFIYFGFRQARETTDEPSPRSA